MRIQPALPAHPGGLGALPRTSKWAGWGTTEKTELRRLLDRTSQLFRRPADVGGLLIPVLWFGMDFKGAASKTRPSRIPPLGPEVAARVVFLTLADPPVETTHWTADLMARASGISASAVRRILLDNYAAHKHPKVRAWLDRHERFVLHFTPTSCS